MSLFAARLSLPEFRRFLISCALLASCMVPLAASAGALSASIWDGFGKYPSGSCSGGLFGNKSYTYQRHDGVECDVVGSSDIKCRGVHQAATGLTAYPPNSSPGCNTNAVYSSYLTVSAVAAISNITLSMTQLCADTASGHQCWSLAVSSTQSVVSNSYVYTSSLVLTGKDTDGDGALDERDNCAFVSNSDQANIDNDLLGDACDADDDNDGVPDASDAFPLDASESLDADSDGIGNNADNCKDISNANQLDTDADGLGDVCDSEFDTDSDGVNNSIDNCPFVANANQLNADGDTKGDVCDSTPNGDTDGDGVDNLSDNCPLVSNANQLNTDGDAQGDVCDVFPNDPVTLLQQNGTAKNEHLGSSVALADMNNDGVVDLVVGSPWADVLRSGKLLKKAGKIQIVSGKNNTVIRTISGVLANQQLGAAIAVVPDQNSDGLRDIVVGDPLADVTQFRNNHLPVLKDAGRVLLYSGKDGRILRILVEGNTAGDHFGAAVAVGNVNADNAPDLIVGAPMNDVTAKNAGQISVFNGISKTLLYTRTGNQKAEHFAAAVAVANGHLFVGSPQFDTATNKDAGRVSVFNASDNSSSALLIVEGAVKADAFGTAITAANDDWAVGIPLADSTGKNAGSVQMFSGLNTTAVKILNGAAAGDNFGSALNMQGDVNNDGTNDMAIGVARLDRSGSELLKDTGRAEVLNGAGL